MRAGRTSEARARAQGGDGQQPAGAAASLTPREQEVLRWVAEGKSNAAIAVILSVSPATVKCHVERILEKLRVENRTAAARYAVELRAPVRRPGIGRSADTHRPRIKNNLGAFPARNAT